MENINKTASDTNEISPSNENETVVLYERLNNPIIQNQLINTIKRHRETMNQTRKQLKPNSEGDYEKRSPFEMENIDNEEFIKKELINDINKVFSSTEINVHKNGGSFGREGHVGTIGLYGKNPETGEKFTSKQLSMTEAHEKGHGIRSFSGHSIEFKNDILSGFDTTSVLNDKETLGLWKKATGRDDLSDNEIAEKLIQYMFSPEEITERMSQLKNYFGMKGAEEFTKEHLAYAKEHYIDDVGMKSQMKPFLDAVNPKTEDNFLRLINSIGI